VSADNDAAPGLDPALATALTQELTRHARLLHAMKASMASLVPEGLDPAAFPLLLTLTRCGPRRQGELAEMSMLDPSTVSRYVGQLARAGYVERRPDPQDGRAVQIAASDAGTRVARELGTRRQETIVSALASWDPADIATLVTLLARLNDDLDAFRPHLGRSSLDPSPRGAAPPRTTPLPDPRSPDQENA
jgi:DNA-binding MarR family transcriptional regulator